MKKLVLDELNRASIDEFKAQDKNDFVIVLDNIRSMNNVGSAFRTCDAFAAKKLYLTGITATPPHREITKTAIGAQESVDWDYAENTATLLEQLRLEGYALVAVEQTDASISLIDFQPEPSKKYAFIFGNEVFGVSDEALELVDIAVEIPQFGTKHSLNISVCCGVVSWDYICKKR